MMKGLKLATATACALMIHSTAWAQFGAQSYDTLIIGGKDVSASSPIAVSTVAIVSKTDKGIAICTGSLVDTDLVVTAAHCIDPSAQKTIIAFARDLTSEEGKAVLVKHVAVHPRYNPKNATDTDNFDIALVRVDTLLPAGFAPADLLEDASLLEKGRQATLAGYGATTGDPKAADSGSGKLRETKVSISDPSYGETEVLLDQSHGKGACHGDSGGPAFLKVGGKLKLFGVTSRGIGDEHAGECGQSVAYTSILAHMDFLHSAADSLRSAK